jgi:hypothetical protein
MHGKDMVIPKGHQVTCYTNTDYNLPGGHAPPPLVAAPAAATEYPAQPAVPASADTAPPPQPVTTDAAPSSAGSVTISLGQSIAEVEAINGKPDKIIDLGAKKIYVYRDLKITFTDGKVSDVQ